MIHGAGPTYTPPFVLSFVPKLLAIMLTLTVTGPWMLRQAVRFTVVMFDGIAGIR